MAREATRNSLFTFIVVFIFCISPAAARGPDGHAIVAQIAQNRLRPEVRSKVSAMLNGESLASVSSWADQIRLNRRETSRWHFINFAEGATDYVPSRDCALVEGQGDCIIAAIERAIANLKQEGANSVDALKFLVHSSAICTNRFTPLRPNAAEMASV